MSDPFLGEIRFFGFNFPPRGWATCSGQTLPLAQNTALFALLGTNYGGNGQTTFGLPNLQGSTACSAGQGPGLSSYNVGNAFGTANVTLTQGQLPSHQHGFNAVAASSSQLADTPTAGCHLSRTLNQSDYSNTGVVDTNLAAQTIGPVGGGQPHANEQPYLVLNACIALQGIFPQRP